MEQEVGQRMELLPRRAKPLNFQISKYFPRIVIRHFDKHHRWRITPYTIYPPWVDKPRIFG